MTVQYYRGQFRRALFWLLYGLACLWLAVALSWWGYARLNYGYGFWYSALHIRDHIERYAPQNPTKPGFAQLAPAQHKRAFTQIRKAVHNHGRGLRQITYPGPYGEPVRLLDRDEITHLQDVSRLLDRGLLASLVVGLLWCLLAPTVARLGRPALRIRVGAVVLLVVTVTLVLVIAGPTQVFYAFHRWMFPPGHPWFFYWQESLMSTLMKAPYLFGAIAAVIGAVAVLVTPLIYLGGLWAAGHLWRRPGQADAD